MKDHNINNFFDIVIEKEDNYKYYFIISIYINIFALTATPLYKTSIYIIPPQEKDINALNIKERNGQSFLTSDDQIKSQDVYNMFMVNAQSRKYQRDYFFKNNLS